MHIIYRIFYIHYFYKKKVNGYFYNFYIYITLYCITWLGSVSSLRWPKNKSVWKKYNFIL